MTSEIDLLTSRILKRIGSRDPMWNIFFEYRDGRFRCTVKGTKANFEVSRESQLDVITELANRLGVDITKPAPDEY